MPEEQDAHINPQTHDDYFSLAYEDTLHAQDEHENSRRHRSSFGYNDDRLVHSTPPESPLGFGSLDAERDAVPKGYSTNSPHDTSGNGVADDANNSTTRLSTTRWLAQKHGIRHRTRMYASAPLYSTYPLKS